MKNTLIIALLAIITLSCNRIETGHVGIKVNMYGSEKGVSDVTEVTGWVFYNPLSTKVYEFPTFIQHKEYSGVDSFIVNSKDGSEFSVSPLVNYQVVETKIPAIFEKYRKTLKDIENGYLKTAIFDSYRIAANQYTAEDLISNRQEFEIKVKGLLDSQLLKEGFMITQFTSNLVYPETFKKAIEAKNNAVQQALMAENRVKQAEAEAKINIAKAEGSALSMLTVAKAEAETYKLKQQTISLLVLQQMWIEKWDGKLPTTSLANGQNAYIGIK